MPFDRDPADPARYALCLEASHNRARIVHWRDHTGRAIMESRSASGRRALESAQRIPDGNDGCVIVIAKRFGSQLDDWSLRSEYVGMLAAASCLSPPSLSPPLLSRLHHPGQASGHTAALELGMRCEPCCEEAYGQMYGK